MRLNSKFFYDYARAHLFDGRLTQDQIEGVNGFFRYWIKHVDNKDDRWLAYILATAHHEVDQRMQPIKEYGSTDYFHRMYDIRGERPHVARRLGNMQPGDGAKFCGRGFVQLTGRTNYEDWTRRLGVNLVANPDSALELPIATEILFRGMVLGTFTSKKLADYFGSKNDDWVNARRIINGVDKARLIAGYGKQYYAAISYKA